MQNAEYRCGMGIGLWLRSQSRVMVRVIIKARVGVIVRFYFFNFAIVFAQIFRNFYVVCIAQMQNGNGVSIMVRVGGLG